MSVHVDPGEVAAANLAGRLHPSQRGMVLDGLFWGLAAITGFVVVTTVFAVVKTGFTVPVVMAVVACLALLAGAIRFGTKRLAEFREPLTVITGPAHDFGTGPITDDHPIGIKHSKGKWLVRAGGRTYRADRENLVAGQITAVCILASRRLVNVL
ncbi:hypothetical protein [Amycolatopsis jejuensis]|uniref:hypothetical protein n=1 Tax=Amycolatopsis jejuensis TaxID=330084 RepID=UPI00068B44BD|nr:hypothetical protein [Amycolatopsis jejuensis]